MDYNTARENFDNWWNKSNSFQEEIKESMWAAFIVGCEFMETQEKRRRYLDRLVEQVK